MAEANRNKFPDIAPRHDVRFGSRADVRTAKRQVRFTPNSDHESRHVRCKHRRLLWAKSGREQFVFAGLLCCWWNDRGSGPCLRYHFHHYEAKRHIGLIFCRMCDVSSFVIVVPSLVDGDNSPLGYGDLARKNVSNPWPSVVMCSYECSRRKCELGSSHLEFIVKLSQMTKCYLLDLDL